MSGRRSERSEDVEARRRDGSDGVHKGQKELAGTRAEEESSGGSLHSLLS